MQQLKEGLTVETVAARRAQVQDIGLMMIKANMGHFDSNVLVFQIRFLFPGFTTRNECLIAVSCVFLYQKSQRKANT